MDPQFRLSNAAFNLPDVDDTTEDDVYVLVKTKREGDYLYRRTTKGEEAQVKRRRAARVKHTQRTVEGLGDTSSQDLCQRTVRSGERASRPSRCPSWSSNKRTPEKSMAEVNVLVEQVCQDSKSLARVLTFPSTRTCANEDFDMAIFKATATSDLQLVGCAFGNRSDPGMPVNVIGFKADDRVETLSSKEGYITGSLRGGCDCVVCCDSDSIHWGYIPKNKPRCITSLSDGFLALHHLTAESYWDTRSACVEK